VADTNAAAPPSDPGGDLPGPQKPPLRLIHGTTRRRAEGIIERGPDVRYREPGGRGTEDGFSLYLEAGPFMFKSPEAYARGKAAQCPTEGGPVILILDVPDDVIARTDLDSFPLRHGLVQFDPGFGLEELLAAWPAVAATAQIRSVT
jgi:hypothetical protein